MGDGGSGGESMILLIDPFHLRLLPLFQLES